MKFTYPVGMILLMGFLLTSCASKDTTVEEEKTPPNIIFIMSDDHTYNAVGAYQRRLASVNPTPVLDELAAGGMLFTNVFCTNSICTPSRATIMTGQYSQTNGVLDLDGRLPKDRQHLAHEFKKLGYQTAVVGKWHLKDAPEAFDYYNVLPVQGKYFDPILYSSEGGDSTYQFNFSGGVKRSVEATQYKGHSSDVITDLTIEWLDKKRSKDQPFFLMHHYKAPHDDFEFAPRYANYLEDVPIPEPENLYHQPDFGSVALTGAHNELVRQIGTSVSDRHQVRNYTTQYEITTTPRDSATSEAYQIYLKRYLRCVKGVDDNLGRLFQYLKDHDLWDNTVIVYTGDQGMMLGEHDFMDKRWMYDESMRMPFIMSFPNGIKAGSQSDLLINNTDFAPTFLELAGAKVPEYMQGRSFAAATRGESVQDWREATYYRYWMHLVHHDVPAHFGVRTPEYKLIFYYSEHYNPEKNGTKSMHWKPNSLLVRPTPVAWEFYDLTKDPHEVKNQYDNPAYKEIIQSLKEELIRQREVYNETDEQFPHLKEKIEANWGD